MEQHVKLVGWLQIGVGILTTFLGFAVWILLVLIGAAADDPEATRILAIVGGSVCSFLTLISLPGIIGGIGLLNWQGWARILCLIIGFLQLVNIPVGTTVGIYTIWVLLKGETVQLFASGQATS